eukprot:6435185-Ditylum_brightwellii.AAC.1
MVTVVKTDSKFPAWESCINSWSKCCVYINLTKKYYCPGYKGVDWVSDASCCQLRNGGTWSGQGETIHCEPTVTPQLLCSSKGGRSNTMLCRGVKAEE